MLYSLLDVSKEVTDTVVWISVGAVILLFCVVALICIRGKRDYDARHLAFAGICLALSFALSYLKISPLAYGGSITLASFVPLLVYAYAYGVVDGLLVGGIFGLLNFLSGPYILTAVTFLLDYLLAFASIGLMGFFRKLTKKDTVNLVVGTLAVYLARFLFHLVSGFIYFAQGAVWVELPGWAMQSAFLYSFLYQLVYLPADCLIAALVLYLLARFRVIDRLMRIIKPKEKRAVPLSPEEPSDQPPGLS